MVPVGEKTIMKKEKIYTPSFKVAKIAVQGNLKKAISSAIEEIGGFENFLKKEDRVFLKPNFNTADPPPASSDPLFIKAVIELLLDFGIKEIILGESSTFSLSTRKVMEKLGILKFEKEFGIKIVIFDEEKWIKKEIPQAIYLKKVSIPEIVEKVDKIICLPSLKTHREAQITGSLKLHVGFMRKRERIFLHLSHLQEKIAELNLLFNPALVIMDARVCFIKGGPQRGKREFPGLVLASESRLVLDIEGIKIIQQYPQNKLAEVKPEEIRQIKRAIALNIK